MKKSMKLNELPVSQEIKNHVQISFNLANDIIKRDEELIPKLFLSNIVSGENMFITPLFRNEEEKNNFVKFAQNSANKMKADLSIFTAESYQLHDEDAREYQGNMAKYKYSMANHPNRKEVVIFSIETLFQKIIGFAEINDKRHLEEIEFTKPEKIEGRILQFLSKN